MFTNYFEDKVSGEPIQISIFKIYSLSPNTYTHTHKILNLARSIFFFYLILMFRKIFAMDIYLYALGIKNSLSCLLG